ncbi:MAG: hypothetical protein CMO01_29890 [Thalassobius sp.]|nr:hypothetical protein [Thalassovita sp.]|tara:strand:- start:221 stop:433 length:213 start_codon:yes stop_codon:yes gene_type:complete
MAYFFILSVISIFIGTFYLSIYPLFKIDVDFTKENYVFESIISDLEHKRNNSDDAVRKEQEILEEEFINF